MRRKRGRYKPRWTFLLRDDYSKRGWVYIPRAPMTNSPPKRGKRKSNP